MAQRFSIEIAPYLYDQRAAFAFLRSRRWREGIYCPRCGSRHVREVRTIRVLEAIACNDCRYNFTTTANTFFHSGRRPVYVGLQLVAAFEFMDASVRPRDVGKLFGMKQTTMQRQLHVLETLPRIPFAASGGHHLPLENFATVTAFLEQPGIAFFPEIFGQRIDQLLAPAGRSMRRPVPLAGKPGEDGGRSKA
jgi:transposase-like protein